eukprot:CAMPEP_0117004680 /NCGR_PEP_ID=MMETSP0472-20121206/5559_1 /TAXON_ID=693140 ORGANISM="Tiarina fusus, Strain LIS" /NCGR_SAMPLE_ID=MMETSP0472 /ASSEMBLY_ACC=CAM_ASM_000603 /LENGTH=600 /DNA_ID=CAMNT_0004705689 /DNA_START=219 /DNA_END=2021 /DNA_ORIENTATION=-
MPLFRSIFESGRVFIGADPAHPLVGRCDDAVSYDGTLYYISKATKMFFLHQYKKNFSKVQSNVKLDKDSNLGSYITGCQEFMKDDTQSYPTIYALKGICALVPGVPLGILPFIPFSIGVALITIYRLPVNFYKTMKIAMFTVVLKWDLKLAAFFMLPFAHIVFPLVVVVTALIGSFFYFVFATTTSIAMGKSPFEKWDKFKTGLEEYYRAHQEFVGKHFGDRYDHPTGIPSGWQGESYGIPIQKILKWQWDFLVCCFLLLIGFPICLSGAAVIFGVKLIPGVVSWSMLLCKHIARKSTTEILGCWAFYLVGFFLVPVGALLAVIIATAIGSLTSFTIPGIYLAEGYAAGFYAPFHLLYEMDGWNFFDLDDFRVLVCLPDEGDEEERRQNRRNNASDNNRTNTYEARRKFSEAYWDRFASQCIRSTSESPRQGLDFPRGCAVHGTVRHASRKDTVQDVDTEKDDILWKIDGTLCKGKNRPPLENVAAFFLPKVMEAKRLLSKKTDKRAVLSETSNANILAAMICSNTDETTDGLKAFINAQKIGEKGQPNETANRHIRAKLVELSLAILRVKPFQDRMISIFEYSYTSGGGGAGVTLDDDA